MNRSITSAMLLIKAIPTAEHPFLDGKCTENGGIYIVYGHHMSNGTMFASLPSYADKSYWEQHKTIRFDTLYKHGEYEVIVAFMSKIYMPEQKGFRYYEYTDLSSKIIFDSYIEQVMDSALYDTGMTVEYGIIRCLSFLPAITIQMTEDLLLWQEKSKRIGVKI